MLLLTEVSPDLMGFILIHNTSRMQSMQRRVWCFRTAPPAMAQQPSPCDSTSGSTSLGSGRALQRASTLLLGGELSGSQTGARTRISPS